MLHITVPKGIIKPVTHKTCRAERRTSSGVELPTTQPQSEQQHATQL